MKVIVIGGSGLIGSKLVNILRKQGHEVVSASPSSEKEPLRDRPFISGEASEEADLRLTIRRSPDGADY